MVSWAAVDFDEHRKPLWYALRNAYRPRLATIQPRDGGLALILLNDTPERWAGPITVSRLAFDGTVLATEELRRRRRRARRRHAPAVRAPCRRPAGRPAKC